MVEAATREQLRAWRRTGDKLADGVVAQIRPGTSNDELAKLLVRLFRWQPGTDPSKLPGEVKPPQEAIDFLMLDGDLPAWFDSDRVERGQDLYRKYRRTALMILGCASLPECYSQTEIAATLILSGRLASQVRRRIGETIGFVDTVMQPGSLQGGRGLRAIRKVRLIHAVMRALTLEDPGNYEDRTDGHVGDVFLKRMWLWPDRMPIDQVEMAFVLLTFSHVVLQGWNRLGINLSRQMQSDYLFTWAVIGHMLGIDEPLLPEAPRAILEAPTLFRQIKEFSHKEDAAQAGAWGDTLQGRLLRRSLDGEAGRLLAAALLVLLRDKIVSDLPQSSVPLWMRPGFRSFPRSLIRRLVDPDTSRELWVEPAPLLPRLLHWVLLDFLAFGRVVTGKFGAEPCETDLWHDLGDRIEAQFCQATHVPGRA